MGPPVGGNAFKYWDVLADLADLMGTWRFAGKTLGNITAVAATPRRQVAPSHLSILSLEPLIFLSRFEPVSLNMNPNHQRKCKDRLSSCVSIPTAWTSHQRQWQVILLLTFTYLSSYSGQGTTYTYLAAVILKLGSPYQAPAAQAGAYHGKKISVLLCTDICLASVMAQNIWGQKGSEFKIYQQLRRLVMKHLL